MSEDQTAALAALTQQAQALGFSKVGVSGLDSDGVQERLAAWLEAGYHGEMGYLKRRQAERGDLKRYAPEMSSVVMFSHPYPLSREQALAQLSQPQQAYVAGYALGEDYHRLIGDKLAQLQQLLAQWHIRSRAFVDTAPVLEVHHAERSNLGWRGKHTLLLNRQGSAFFLSGLLVDALWPHDKPSTNLCHRCRLCMDACPTGAIVAPYLLDARRCIAYLTIELKGSIPLQWRRLIGNRIYGCDDCQLVCPWLKHAPHHTHDPRLAPRHGLDSSSLLELWSWSEEQFTERTHGSPIQRLGYERWRRNLAVALGNAPASAEVLEALQQALAEASDMVREHIEWALGGQ